MFRYRFKTKSVDDPRPLVDLAEIKMPWWCTGYGEKNGEEYAVIVCYLPSNVDLAIYWDDAFDIDVEEVDEIKYTGRFPKPEWLC